MGESLLLWLILNAQTTSDCGTVVCGMLSTQRPESTHRRSRLLGQPRGSRATQSGLCSSQRQKPILIGCTSAGVRAGHGKQRTRRVTDSGPVTTDETWDVQPCPRGSTCSRIGRPPSTWSGPVQPRPLLPIERDAVQQARRGQREMVSGPDRLCRRELDDGTVSLKTPLNLLASP